MSTLLTYAVHEVVPYINWIYFFHAWGFAPEYATAVNVHGCEACRLQWLSAFAHEKRAKAEEALTLGREAREMLETMDKETIARSLFRLCRANAEGDNLWLEGVCFPLLRQQTARREGEPFLCLSDFVRPLSSGILDTVGLFASSVDDTCEARYSGDPYKHLLVQTLADRLAEAATEKMHEYVRKRAWGYVPGEALTIPELLQEKFQGIRPAVGYPSLPDQSVNFLMDRLLDMKAAGISLTEHGAMKPHASVCGLMLAHPDARYFAVGRIGEDQLKDYAARRGIPVAVMRKFLAGNLA
ncbi:MAG: 5-methyltetrahydrofolate--homocysteine methyltransferase [Prevotellaceae bacterium]|nr:5-methyltetrahydrofolate--homocysteine methyltransferase [Prevotellaceae bacterium]